MGEARHECGRKYVEKLLHLLLGFAVNMKIKCTLFPLSLFRAAPAAYGGSQARGGIGAAAANLPHSSRQRRIHKPLNEAREPTLILKDTGGVITAEPPWGLLNFILFLYLFLYLFI